MDDRRYDMDSRIQDKDKPKCLLPNVKAYMLFDEGKDPLEVAAGLNLPGPLVQQFYVEYLNLIRMHKLVTISPEVQDGIGVFPQFVPTWKGKRSYSCADNETCPNG